MKNLPTIEQMKKSRWQIEVRWCGHHNCFSERRTVLSLGKWSISGTTGNYVVTGPDGWDIERRHPFSTEQEAMEWVESKEPLNPSVGERESDENTR